MKNIARISMLAVAFCIAAGAMTADADAAETRQVSLDQPFDDERQTYTATVPNDVTEVTVNVSPSDPKARVTVNGGDPDTPVQLAVGENTIEVVVTAEDARYTRTYTVTVTRQSAAPATVAVTLSATPNPVGEGSPVTVTATLAAALAEAVTIPLTTTRGTSEDGDHGSLASITVPAGGTSATGTVSTSEDGDGDDETFTVALGSLPSGLAAGSASSVQVTITDNGAQQQQQRTEPLTAAFERAPAAHDGTGSFWFNVRFSEALGETANAPADTSFAVQGGKVKRVRKLKAGLWRVRIAPKSWRDVTVSLSGGRDCAAKGAVCTADGRALSNSPSLEVGGPVRIRIAGGKAREGRDSSIDFAVTLNRAAAHAVSVDYATADGTAMAGADYTAASGTLTFAPGETAKTVSVAILDDAIDEGKEKFVLRLSNPKGAYLRNMHREAKGVIRNDDPLQSTWLAHFGRMVASDVLEAVTARLETPRDAGAYLTFAGQPLDPWRTGDVQAPAGFAPAFGARGAPANDDGVFARRGLSGAWTDPAATTSRSMTGRELLAGTSFRAVLGNGVGPLWTSWGQGASVSQFSTTVPGLDLSGTSATGLMGMDFRQGRLLMGFAMTHSLGEGTGHDPGWRYALESTATMMVPYARLALSERMSVWGLAGTGTGSLSLDLDGAVPQHYRTDLSMKLAAAGVRGDLVTPAEPGGFALALKADAFWVRTESDRVAVSEFGNLMAARGESSRVRAVLDGSRTFALAGGATLAPSLELGLRHDGGDAETGTGLEVGAVLGYANPLRGLDMALRVHGLAVHAQDGYNEWGVSGSLRLVPGAAGRGLSMSLTPSWGADPGGSERLWRLPDVSGLAANDDADPSSRLDAEVGYGMAMFGGRFTGTPNAGFGLSDTAREVRMGWQLNPAGTPDDFSFRIEAARRESAGDTPEHRIGFGVTSRW